MWTHGWGLTVFYDVRGYGNFETERSFRSFLVCVKRLWIELNRERLDLRLVDGMCRAGKALTDIQIVKLKAALPD